jgi:hypothetical protein
MSDYKTMVKDADFRCQYDTTPRDPEVDALLSGVEPQRVVQTGSRVGKSLPPSPKFTWLKPLR